MLGKMLASTKGAYKVEDFHNAESFGRVMKTIRIENEPQKARAQTNGQTRVLLLRHSSSGGSKGSLLIKPATRRINRVRNCRRPTLAGKPEV